MELLVTDLTRMKNGKVCIAGIDLDTGARARPVTGAPLEPGLISINGGPFDFRNVVDLGKTKLTPSKPQIEDIQFDPRRASRTRRLTGPSLIRRLEKCRYESLESAFGPELRQEKRSLVAREGRGKRSLAVVFPPGRIHFDIKTWPGEPDRARIRWNDVDLVLQDLRLYDKAFKDAVPSKVAALERRVKYGGNVYLCVGLTRAMQGVHWLQVNSIHLESDPDWSLM